MKLCLGITPVQLILLEPAWEVSVDLVELNI